MTRITGAVAIGSQMLWDSDLVLSLALRFRLVSIFVTLTNTNLPKIRLNGTLLLSGHKRPNRVWTIFWGPFSYAMLRTTVH